jgi:plastocyanin
MIQEAWSSFLDFISQFVIPDWGGLIALLPVFIGIVVILFFARMIYVYATIGPSRVRAGRRKPTAPEGVHLPGPTFAPVIGAVGLFLLFAGIVFGGVWLVIGLVALVLSLLVWGYESLKDYDHVAESPPQQVDKTFIGPPPGVHVPGPTFRPILVALGVGLLFAGIVFGGWLLLIGIVFTIATLLGWLNDARKEYRHVVEADTTGHIENEPAPAWPKRLLWSMAILVVVAVVLDQGWLPPRSASGGGEAGGSPPPPGAPSGEPSGPAGPPGAITVVAEGVKFNPTTINAPAGTPFQITLDNKDAGTPHDIDILDGAGAKVFDGKDFPGVATETYDVPALEAGAYQFICSIHPALMIGDLTAGP